MYNKAVLVIVFLLLVFSLVAPMIEFTFVEHQTIAWWASVSYGFATLIGGYLLVQNSDIRSTILWRILSVTIGLVIIGATFKVLHLIGADDLLMIGCGGMLVTYLIRFFNKRSKNTLDILKVLTVVSYCVISLSVILHLIARDYAVITKIFFWATMADFAYHEWRDVSSTFQKK